MSTQALGRSSPTTRVLFLDNLRWVIIVLVISMHAADTYSPLGNWYFTDRGPVARSALLAFAIWQMYLQSFFMGLLFFIAGIFVPASFERKGRRRFLRDRAFRLGLPVLFYMFVLGPVTEYFFAHSWTSTETTSFANEWLKHIRNGHFLQENGPLWFCLALLIFCFLYAGFQSLPFKPAANKEGAPPSTKTLLLFALLLSVSRFLVRAIIPRDFSVLNMHIGDFAQYVLLFSAGIRAGSGGWLPKLDFRAGVLWLVFVLPIGFAAWLTLLFTGGALTGNWHNFSGGWHWQSAAISVWEAFTCVAFCFVLLVVFREYFNMQSRLAAFLSANAFAVYVFHPPIVILCARLMHNLTLPPVPKALTLTCIATVLSFAISAALFRRIPLLREIL
jgi:glucans biosynthesis protein C